jgi:hypothetical protein
VKRRLLLILLLLLAWGAAGAIINVAVAWGCVIRWYYHRQPMQTFTFTPAEGAAVWDHLALPGWIAEPRLFVSSQRHAVGIRVINMEGGHIRTDGYAETARYLAHEARAGWPLMSLRYVSRLDNADPGWMHHGRLTIPVAIAGRPSVVVPMIPVWPGFALNTVFYAGILWLLFAAPFALRRRLRIKRGLCPKCAYPVGESAVCTECGATLRKP